MADLHTLAGARPLRAGRFLSDVVTITNRPALIAVECWLDLAALPRLDSVGDADVIANLVRMGVDPTSVAAVDLTIGLQVDEGAGEGWRYVLPPARFVYWDNEPPALEVAYFETLWDDTSKLFTRPQKQGWVGWRARAVLEPTHSIVLIRPGILLHLDEDGLERAT